MSWYPGKLIEDRLRKRREPLVPPEVMEKAEKGKESMEKPADGRSFSGQTEESYCVECIEGHTMTSLTEMRHAIDRYRTAGKMTEGVSEKVRVAIAELMGIEEDARNTSDAAPAVKAGIDNILNQVRWVRKEYGVSGVGLTVGQGAEQDLLNLRDKIQAIQNEAYNLVQVCPTCNPRIQAAMAKALGKAQSGT